MGTVTSGGLYTAPIVTATKTAYVTATCVADTTKKATATVTVKPPPPTLTQIALSPSSASINIGSQQQFTATAYDQYDHTMTGIAFTFLSSKYSVTMIDSASGLATGEAAGTAYISAYSGSITSKTAPLTVSVVAPPPPVTLTRLSPNIGLVGMSGDYKSLTIVGTGFVSGTVVNYGSEVLTPTAITPTTVTVTVPVAEFSAVRTVSVSVTNPGTAPSPSLPFYVINQGFVSLTFDDGYYSAYSKGLPILDAAGIKSTFYTITTLVGDTVDGYVTQSQLQALYKNGHENAARITSGWRPTGILQSWIQTRFSGPIRGIRGPNAAHESVCVFSALSQISSLVSPREERSACKSIRSASGS